MFGYLKKLFSNFLVILILIGAAVANWQWPLYVWLDNLTVYRFIWLGIFFVLLDIFIEIIIHSAREVRLITESISFSKNLHKLSDGFHLITKISLPNGLRADFIAVGSSGVWLVDLRSDDGKVEFNGDDLVQNGAVLHGYVVKVLEKSYALSQFLKSNLHRDIKVAPVIAFSSSQAILDSVPKIVKGVYITARTDAVSLVENTDFQITDKNTIEEVFKILKK